jgi:membrane-associated HD superfamily phosphohydrolase
MLADSVEAASRSLKEPDEESSVLVDRIVKYKLDQNQFSKGYRNHWLSGC